MKAAHFTNTKRLVFCGLLAVGLLITGVLWPRNRWPFGRSGEVQPPAAAFAVEHGRHDSDRDEEEAEERDRSEVVRLASAGLARRIGIETAEVVKERHAQRLIVNAEAAYDGRRYTDVLARVTGIVHEARVEPNQAVERGDVLAVLDSATVGTAKTQYRTSLANLELAQATYDRVRTLTKKEIVAGKSELETLTALTQAKNNLLDAEQKLRNFGYQEVGLEQIAAAESTTNLIEVVSPMDGYIIAWDATLGEAVEPVTQLFTLADTGTMWLWMDVYESDISDVEIGQPVTFSISATAEPVFAGKVAAIGTEVDRVTRTTRVRAELANPAGRLRANQFGQARIEVRPEHEAVIVPAAAVQRDETNNELVFLSEEPGIYHPRRIVTRPIDDGDRLEVVEGLQAGENVVTTGAFLLVSELYKDRIAEEVD